MSLRKIDCCILVCDGCGESYDNGDYIPHGGDSRDDAINDDWRSDGEHDWCRACRSKSHDCAPDPDEPDVCVRCDAEIETEPSNEGDQTA